MKFLRRELKRSVLTNWRYHLLIYLTLAVIVLIGYVSIYNLTLLKNNAAKMSFSFSNNSFYTLTLPYESVNVIDEDGTIRNSTSEVLKEIYQNPALSPYSMYGDYISLPLSDEGEKILPEVFEEGYEDNNINTAYSGQILRAYTVTPSVFDAFGMKLSEGRWFEEADLILYEEHGYSTAAVLGSAYRDYYEVGDVIAGDPNAYGAERNVTIIGFLEEGTLFGNKALVPLDRYILLPIHEKKINLDGSVTVPQEGESPETEGFITLASKLDVKTLQSELDRITSAYGAPGITCTQSGGQTMKTTENVVERNVYLFAGLAVILCVLAIVSMVILLNRKTQKNLQTYVEYISSGIRPREILLAIALESFLFSVLAVIPTILVSYLAYGELFLPAWQLLFLSIPVTFLSLLPASWRIKLYSRS